MPKKIKFQPAGQTNLALTLIISTVAIIIVAAATFLFFYLTDKNLLLRSKINTNQPMPGGNINQNSAPTEPIAGADEDQNGIPDEVEKNLKIDNANANQNQATNPSPNNGIPDEIEKIINQAPSNSASNPTNINALPTAPVDNNNNGIPDEIEKIIKTN